MSTQRSICPKCKGGPFPSGASFSIHLSWCKSPGTVWDNFSHGEENYNRLLSEATIPTTLTQRINAVSRDMKRPHIEGTTRNRSLLSSMPSIPQLAMAPSHPDDSQSTLYFFLSLFCTPIKIWSPPYPCARLVP